MSKEVIIAKGSFSKLTITVNDDMVNKLSVIEKENNPLGKIDHKLKKLLQEFETAYFKATKVKL